MNNSKLAQNASLRTIRELGQLAAEFEQAGLTDTAVQPGPFAAIVTARRP